MAQVKLIDVYPLDTWKLNFLFKLLSQRDPIANISHHRIPSWQGHRAFVEAKPYLAWYIICVDDEVQEAFGAVYLTKQREIGIFLRPDFIGLGFGKEAFDAVLKRHPGPLLANIAPGNERSIKFFTKLGFKHIQNTYRLDEEGYSEKVSKWPRQYPELFDKK